MTLVVVVLPVRYSRYQDGPARLGWLLDMNATTQVDEDNRERSGLDIYFLQQVSQRCSDTTIAITTIDCSCPSVGVDMSVLNYPA